MSRKPRNKIDFDTPDPYIEWHVIDQATHRSITHHAVAAGTAYVVEATVRAQIVKHRVVTEDTIGEEE